MTPSSADTPAASAPPPTAPVRSRRPAIAAIATLALLLVGLLVYEFDARDRGTDDAYVTGHLHVISPRVAGTVERVLVDDNQFVHAGDALVQIDRRDFDVRVAAQHASPGACRCEPRTRADRAGRRGARVGARRCGKGRTRLRPRAQLTRETPRGLSKQGVRCGRCRPQVGPARVAAADAQRRSASPPPRQPMPRRARTMPSCATRCCSSATRRSSRRRTATSARRPSRPASTSRPAKALLTLVEPHPWIVANFRETQLRRVRAGDVVQLRFDALPQRVFTGRIDSLSPATAPSSHCCRPTMRPAISRRSRSACP